jgi:hypothetical protein
MRCQSSELAAPVEVAVDDGHANAAALERTFRSPAAHRDSRHEAFELLCGTAPTLRLPPLVRGEAPCSERLGLFAGPEDVLPAAPAGHIAGAVHVPTVSIAVLLEMGV